MQYLFFLRLGSSYYITTQSEDDTSSQMKVDEKREDISWCYHIPIYDSNLQEEEDAPSELKKGVKTIIDPLKEVNLCTNDDTRLTYCF